MDAATLKQHITEIQTASNAVLGVIETVDPEVKVPAEVASATLTLLGTIITAATAAYSKASQTDITVESILALLPNATPLPAPTS